MGSIVVHNSLKRFLGGKTQNDDLMKIFLFLRENSGGRQSIQEVGDFVAHRAERRKGIVSQNVKDWSIISSHFARRAFDGHHNYNWHDLPSDIPDFVGANFRRMSAEELRQGTGFRQRYANKIFNILLKRFIKISKNRYAIDLRIGKDEEKLLNFLMSSLKLDEAFTCNQLMKEFSGCLIDCGLMSTFQEKALNSDFRTCLFAATMMHNCTILLDHQRSATLKASAESAYKVTVYASVPVHDIGKPQEISWAAPIYTVQSSSKCIREGDMIFLNQHESDIDLSPEGMVRVDKIG